MHRQNASERCIQTYKNHFLAGAASLPPEFPITFWCSLLAQANITLNMMRPCRQNPALSAHAAMNGCFNFEATPMAPPGTKAFVHVKPGRRATWGFHAADAWYVGPAMKHYRCAAIRNEPMNGPPDYLQAVQRLRAVLLGEKSKPVERPTPSRANVTGVQECESVPTHTSGPNATPEHPTGLQRLPQVTQEEAGNHRIHQQEEEADTVPALISQEEESESEDEEEFDQPCRPHYNLRNRSQATAHGVIFEESPNVRTTEIEPVHNGKFSLAAKVLRVRKAYKSEMYCPVGMFAGAVLDPDTGKSLEYRDLIKVEKYREVWMKSFAKELDRLAQGKLGNDGTDTIFFIPKSEMPRGRTATYGRICVNYRPQKEDPYRTRLAVGGNRIDYSWDVSTPTADMTTSKLLINSVISTMGAEFMTADIKNFYLCTPLKRFEYMRQKARCIRILPVPSNPRIMASQVAASGICARS